MTSRKHESTAHVQNSGEAAEELHSRVQAGINLVAQQQDAIDWQIQVLHRQFDLLQEYTAQISAEIAALEQKWRDLDAARTKLVAAEQQLDGEGYEAPVQEAR